jgi:hypothetical protein
MNRDFAEMLSALSEAKAEFLVVGAYALAAHGTPRATGDLDIWVRPSMDNSERVWTALEVFGAPMSQLTKTDLQQPGIVFQIGIAPGRIDLLTSITAVDFDEAWEHHIDINIGGRVIPVLGRHELIKNKRALGRPRDLADVDALDKQPAPE